MERKMEARRKKSDEGKLQIKTLDWADVR